MSLDGQVRIGFASALDFETECGVPIAKRRIEEISVFSRQTPKHDIDVTRIWLAIDEF